MALLGEPHPCTLLEGWGSKGGLQALWESLQRNFLSAWEPEQVHAECTSTNFPSTPGSLAWGPVGVKQ